MNIKIQQIEKFDPHIKKVSQQSSKAPADFLEAELRRWINVLKLPNSNYVLSEENWKQMVSDLEQEYRCYFERDLFVPTLKQKNWNFKFIYAGCNSQIEEALDQRGLQEALTVLGCNHSPCQIVGEVPRESLREDVAAYLVGIGYLFPVGDVLKTHSNLVWGQLAHSHFSIDSPFLTRDLIRCPYHWLLKHDASEPLLSLNEAWEYWKDLCALSLSKIRENVMYSPSNFKKRDTLEYSSDMQERDIFAHLQYGQKLIPQRYCELKAKIEPFEWVIPREKTC